MVVGVVVAAVAAVDFVSTTDTWAAVVGLPAASPGHPPRDDEDVDLDDAPRALGDEDGEARNILRSSRILRLIVPQKKHRKESTPPDDDADDSHIVVEIVDGSSGDHYYCSRKSLRQSKVYNYSGYIPRWGETSDQPWRK